MPEKSFDLILLPGYRLAQDGSPQSEMLLRADRAFEVWKKYHVPVVCCGADAAGCGVSEAEVLRGILSQKGVPESDIIKEDNSYITAENFRNAFAIAGGKRRAALVTSDWHMARAKLLAKKAGFKVKGFKAHTASGRVKNHRRILEFMGILDALCGWQTDRPRPASVEKLKRRMFALFGDK